MKKIKKADGYIYMTSLSARLKEIKANNRTYVVDVDQSIFWILFPFYHWFFVIRVFEIPFDEVNKIKSINYEKRKNLSIGLWAAIIGITIGSLLKPISNLILERENTVINIFILSAIILVIMYMRYLFHKKSNKSINGFEGMESKYIKLRPASFLFYLKMIFFYIFWITFFVLFSATYIYTSNIVFAIGVFIFGLIILFFNIMSPLSGNVHIIYFDKSKYYT